MTLVITGATGTDELEVIDTTSAGPSAFACYVASFDPVVLDASYRRNPVWRTYGHISLTLEETVIWETWLNYQYQIFTQPIVLSHFNTEDLGLLDYVQDAGGDFSIPYRFKWALRESVVLNVYWTT